MAGLICASATTGVHASYFTLTPEVAYGDVGVPISIALEIKGVSAPLNAFSVQALYDTSALTVLTPNTTSGMLTHYPTPIQYGNGRIWFEGGVLQTTVTHDGVLLTYRFVPRTSGTTTIRLIPARAHSLRNDGLATEDLTAPVDVTAMIVVGGRLRATTTPATSTIKITESTGTDQGGQSNPPYASSSQMPSGVEVVPRDTNALSPSVVNAPSILSHILHWLILHVTLWVLLVSISLIGIFWFIVFWCQRKNKYERLVDAAQEYYATHPPQITP